MPEWKVSTPIDTFTHPETGSQIDLVSVVHVGQPSYYRKLGSYIMARQDEGFTVHYEEIATGDEAVEPTSPLERIKWRIQEARINESAESYASVMLHSSYTMQENSVLFRDTDSENHDITEADVVRQTSLVTSLRGLRSARKERRKLEKAASKGSDVMDEVVFGVIKEGVDTAKSGKARNKRQDKVTIHVRNQVALEGVDTALAENPTARLVLIWGVGHLAGLQSGLLDRGYEHTGSEETDLAVNRAQLERNIKKHEASLRRQQAKLDRRQVTTASRRNVSPTSFETDFAKRQEQTRKLLEESRKRSAKTLKRLELERQRREKYLFDFRQTDDKKQTRRYMPWFSAK